MSVITFSGSVSLIMVIFDDGMFFLFICFSHVEAFFHLSPETPQLRASREQAARRGQRSRTVLKRTQLVCQLVLKLHLNQNTQETLLVQ